MNDSFKLAPGEWSTLRRLLDQALDLPPAERPAWLAALGADDAPFRPRLQALLARAGDVPATETVARLLDTLPQVETAQFAPAPDDAALTPGSTVGPYRLLRPLGEGGMGEIWLAERTDLLQQRQVALKLPRLVTGRARLAERLAREREILATLEHPNIARLYDAGVGVDGQPWLALEYVEGERIDAWCARKALDAAARLRLFLQVARAVAHAHARLVVHRDLKPANILVTEGGEVRLLDFGIAKLLEDGRAQETELTQLAGRALTPDYAAPEQILGRPIGTAADVYALGVVLFELLTGSRPYKLKRDSRAALEEAIAQAEVQRPSSVVAEANLRRRLRGDLDTIVLKALKRAPAERYGTVEALADDIERYLDQRPVTARPDAASYRLRKFLARNRLVVGAVAAVAAGLVGGAALAIWQAAAARSEQQRAERALGFLTSIFREADPAVGPGRQPSAAELLVRAHERVRVQFADRPAERVEVLNVLAESLLGVEDVDAADRVSQEALDEALALYGERHAQTLRARLARVSLQRSRDDRTRWGEQLELIWPVLQADPQRHADLLMQAGIHRGELALSERRFDDAEASARDLLAQADQLGGGPRHGERAELLKIIAVSLDGRSQFGPALSAAREAVSHAEAAYGDRPHHPALVNKRQLLARQLAFTDRFDEALALMKRAVDDAAANYGPESAQAGQFLQNLTAQSARVGRLREAEESGIRALAILRKHYGSEEPHVVAAIDALAFVHYQARRGEQALRLYDQILALETGPRYIGLERELTVRMRRAAALGWLGRLEEGRGELREVVDRLPRTERNSLTWPLLHLAIIERLAGRSGEALPLLERSLAAVRETPLAERERLFVRTEIGINLAALGRHAEAIEALTKSLQDWDAMKVHPMPHRADALLALGRSRLALAQPALAREPLHQADLFWQEFAPESPWAGEAAHKLALGLAANGNETEAAAARERGRRLLQASPLPIHRTPLNGR